MTWLKSSLCLTSKRCDVGRLVLLLLQLSRHPRVVIAGRWGRQVTRRGGRVLRWRI